MSAELPRPALTPAYRLEATIGETHDLGETRAGRRRIVALTGGTFSGPQIAGELLPGASADYTYRLSTLIETSAPELDWMNKGIFVAVGARRPAGVVYETYLAAEPAWRAHARCRPRLFPETGAPCAGRLRALRKTTDRLGGSERTPGPPPAG